MRNLEILTKSTNTLNQLQPKEEILFTSIDEYTKQIFVFTTQTRVLVYSASTSSFEYKAVYNMTDENPNLETSKVI